MTASRRVAVPVPDAARDEVDAIVAQRAAWQLATRNLRISLEAHTAVGAVVDANIAQADAITASEESLRKRHFPRASRVSVDPWGVYTWSPRGRIVRLVWTRVPRREETPTLSD